MTIILFVAVLVALIVVHEFGHFVAAKLFKMRVDEFGIGYPPKAMGWKRGETEYSLNWLPFGGFVKIYGEDPGTTTSKDSVGYRAGGTDASRSFSSKSHWQQAVVLVAGIGMNLVFAYLILSVTLALGMPRALTSEEALFAPDATLVVSAVLDGSPADAAGIMRGDMVRLVTSSEGSFSGADADAFTSFVASAEDAPLTFTLERGGSEVTLEAVPEAGIIASEPERAALGVGIAPVGTVAVPFYKAPIEGAVLTWEVTKETAAGLWYFFGGLFTFTADLSQVSGPIGIAGAVGDAGASGIIPLLTLTAIISINLALINLIPVPALDGGRLLFVAIEAVTRKPIPHLLANALNFGGFALLILLMLVVTASDLFKLFT